MELAKKPAIALFFGFIIGLVLWVYSLVYIEDKPVPNAVFTQSIIDTKIQAARDLRESMIVFVGGSVSRLILNYFPRLQSSLP